MSAVKRGMPVVRPLSDRHRHKSGTDTVETPHFEPEDGAAEGS